MAVLGHAMREADQALGGDGALQLQSEPAIRLESTSKAWFIHQARAEGFAEDRVQREAEAASHLLSDSLPYEHIVVHLTPDETKVPRLQKIEITSLHDETPLCAPLKAGIGADPEALNCPGTNRRFGEQGKSRVDYCVGTRDGRRNVELACRTVNRRSVMVDSYALWVR